MCGWCFGAEGVKPAQAGRQLIRRFRDLKQRRTKNYEMGAKYMVEEESKSSFRHKLSQNRKSQSNVEMNGLECILPNPPTIESQSQSGVFIVCRSPFTP